MANKEKYEFVLEDSDPAEVRMLVANYLQKSRLTPIPNTLRNWVIDTWKCCEKLPFQPLNTKFLRRLIEGRLFPGIVSFLNTDIPLQAQNFNVFMSLFRNVSKNEVSVFLSFFRRFYLFYRRGKNHIRLRDFFPIWCRRNPEGRLLGFYPSRWRRIAPKVLGRCQKGKRKQKLPLCSHLKCTMTYWDGYGTISLRWLDKLISWQEKELKYIQWFCEEVSRGSRKVVLSWHNATLGAIGGWGFPSPFNIFARIPWNTEEFYKLWNDNENIIKNDDIIKYSLQLFFSRIVLPKLEFYLWLEEMKKTVCDNMDMGICRKILFLFRRYSEFSSLNDMTSEDLRKLPYCFPPSCGDVEQSSFSRLISWYLDHRKRWCVGWALYGTLIDVLHTYLNQDNIEHAVLPRIDKFFISTHRTKDVDYLACLLDYILGRYGDKVIILLWDDSIHASYPSLYLAIDKIRAKGISVKGLGIFDQGLRGVCPVPENVLEQADTCSFFVLRPYERAWQGTFHWLLKNRNYEFFRSYSPTWRDGISVLYAGTQIYPFISLATEPDGFAPWVGCKTSIIPFGLWFRQILRYRLGVIDDFTGVPRELKILSQNYARWANLL